MARRGIIPAFGDWQENQNYTGIFISKKNEKAQAPQVATGSRKPSENVFDFDLQDKQDNPLEEEDAESETQNYTQMFVKTIKQGEQNKAAVEKPKKQFTKMYSFSDSEDGSNDEYEEEKKEKKKLDTPDEAYDSEEETIVFPVKPISLPAQPTGSRGPPQPEFVPKHTPVPQFNESDNPGFTAIFAIKKKEAQAQKPGKAMSRDSSKPPSEPALANPEPPKFVPKAKPSGNFQFNDELSLSRTSLGSGEPKPEQKLEERVFQPNQETSPPLPKRPAAVSKPSAFDLEYNHAYASSPSPSPAPSQEKIVRDSPVPKPNVSMPDAKPSFHQPAPQAKFTPRAPNKPIPPFPGPNSQGSNYTIIFNKMKQEQLQGGGDPISPMSSHPIPPPPPPLQEPNPIKKKSKEEGCSCVIL